MFKSDKNCSSQEQIKLLPIQFQTLQNAIDSMQKK